MGYQKQQSTNVYSLEPLVQSILKMEGINHHPTAIDYDVVWEDEEDIKSNNLAGSPEVTPKIKRENENDKMKRLSINQGKLSERIHTWLNKNIDRLTDNQIESIIEVYNEMSVILPNDKDVIFISVLANTLDYKPKSFKRYLKRSLSKEVSINPNTITLSEKFSDPIENFIDKAFQEQNVPGNRTKKTSESSSSYYQTN